MKCMITALLIGMVALTGCSTITAESGIEMEIHSSKAVKITQVSVWENQGSIVVSGSLRPMSSTTTRAGHVDVDFMDVTGNVLETERVTPHVKMFSRQSSRQPSFSVSAEVEGVSSVRLTHHPDTMNTCEL